jgi:hypothetical protein
MRLALSLVREAFEYFISILFFSKAPAMMMTFYFLLQRVTAGIGLL